jgi:hypothetical protein
MGSSTIFCVGKVTKSGSGCQVGRYVLMRIQTFWPGSIVCHTTGGSGEFHEISVPPGLAPAEQIVRPGRTNSPLPAIQYYAMHTGSTFHPPNIWPLRVLLKHDQIEDESSIFFVCCCGVNKASFVICVGKGSSDERKTNGIHTR